MTRKLGFQLLTLPQIFDGHFFNVPEYQRGYAWDEAQVKDLLEDVDHLMLTSDRGQHFTGTLVVNKVDGSERFDIVDGQQRLSTFVILMRCLRNAISDKESSKRIASCYISRGPLGGEKHVLQVGSDSREFFERVVLGNDSSAHVKASLTAHVKLLGARETIESWLKNKQTGFADVVLPVIEERLGLLVYNPSESAEVGIMFEVINNRGKDLSELEKVKNYLIYVATKLGAPSTREKVNSRWTSILRNLHLANHTTALEEGSFLRAVSVLHFSLNKGDSSYVYDMLRHKFLKIDEVLSTDASRSASIKLIESFIETMEHASRWYAALYGQQHTGLDRRVIAILERLRAQAQHANIMPVFLAVMIRYRGQVDEDSVLPRLLELIEKINFRVYIARGITQRTDSGQGRLYSIAANFFHGEPVHAFTGVAPPDAENSNVQLEYALVNFALTHATDQRVAESLQLRDDDQYDFYKWLGLKYFLMCYEASLKDSKTVKIDNILNARSTGKSGDYFSVEHIWATKHEEETYSRPKDKHVRRRLGNLILLELNLNIAGSNNDIRTKLDLYSGKEMAGDDRDGSLRQPSEMAQVRELISDAKKIIRKINPNEFDDRRCKPYFDLHKDLCDIREKRYSEFTLKQWSLKDCRGYKDALAMIVQAESSESD